MQKMILLVTILLVSLSSLSAQTYTTNAVVPLNGNVFELFENSSSINGQMTIVNNISIKNAKWSNMPSSGNILIRESNRGSRANTQTKVVYSYNIREMSGNVYAGAYGWWKANNSTFDNMCEFYVVDVYNNKSNPTFGMTRVSGQDYSMDGGTYELYYSFKNQGNVYSSSNKPFIQIKAVRKVSRRTSGNQGSTTISMAKHFTKWRNLAASSSSGSSLKQFSPRKIFENSFVFEGFGSDSKLDCNFNAGFASQAKSNDEEDQVIDVNKPAVIDLVVYPNPALGQVTVEVSSLEPVTVSVFSLSGQLMTETKTTTGRATLNMNNTLPAGIYIVRTSEGNSRKLVIN